jgi:cytochrome bd ubiquinol oxidase subunit II
MIAIWYSIVSFMLIAYIVLDGRNFGAGMLHWLVAKTPEERRQVVAAIGPLWPWHEVWLVGFGGTLMAIFPRLMGASFAGYYLALMLILWCLLLRAMALEVGGHINDRLWQQFWDFVFVVSSFFLSVLFGAAAGNVVRGVPVDQSGTFSMAFFTDFNVRGYVGLLDWYTLSIAAFAVVLLGAHGVTYLTLKTEGPVHNRSALLGRRLWLAAIPLLIIVSVETFFVRPQLVREGVANPLSWLGMMVVIASVWALFSGIRCGHEMRAFVGSNSLIVGMLTTGGATIYPVMLYSTIAPEYSLRADQVASSPSTLGSAIFWWPVAFVMAASYFIFISRRYSGKVSVKRDTQGYY